MEFSSKFNHDKCLIIESMLAYDNGGIESGETRFVFVFFEELIAEPNYYQQKMLKVEISNEYYRHAIIAEMYPYLDEYDDADKAANFDVLINKIISSPSLKDLNKTGLLKEWCPNKNRFLSIGVFNKKELPKNIFKGIIDEKVLNVLKKQVPNKLVIFDTKDVIEKLLAVTPYFAQDYIKKNFVCDSFDDVDIDKAKVWDGTKLQSFVESDADENDEPKIIIEQQELIDSMKEGEENNKNAGFEDAFSDDDNLPF